MADLSNFFDDGFDDSAVKASAGVPDPLPPGTYSLMTEKQEIVPTKDGTGVMLKMQYTVASGAHEGQKVFAQFNIKNKSAQAQAIGLGEFKALCLACGVSYDIAKMDTDALNHIPFNAVLGMEKPSINQQTGRPYPPRNRVTKYIPAGESVSAPPVEVVMRPASVVSVAAAAHPAQSGTPWQGPTGQVPF